MANVCMVTGKGTRHGNNVSHSNRRTRRTFCANIHNKRFWLEDEERFVSLKVSSKGMRIIDKLGVSTVVAALRYHGIIN